MKKVWAYYCRDRRSPDWYLLDHVYEESKDEALAVAECMYSPNHEECEYKLEEIEV